jgi:hypothetical protein
MFPQENPQAEQKQPKPRRHNGKFCSFSNRQLIVNALAAGDPKYLIARALHVSEHTVYAVAEQEWQKVAERKARIAAQFEYIATKSCDLLAQKLDTQGHKLTANQLVPIAGVAADKLISLRDGLNFNVHVDHTVHVDNVFEAFQQFHNDALKIIQARETQEPPTFPALPDSPTIPQDLPQA